MDPREQFAATTSELVSSNPQLALVYAEISGQYFQSLHVEHPDRTINVGIREQLLINVGAGMALSGLRPVVHTFGSFLIERAFEQIKLGFGHQGVGGILVGSAGSFDVARGGRTHQSPGDVALVDTLPDVTIHAPGTSRETDELLRSAAAADGLHYVRVVSQQNSVSHPTDAGFTVARRGSGPVVIALGPVLDDVLAATAGRDATVLYASTVRPFDAAGLRAVLPARGAVDIVVVEPWLEGTSARHVSTALVDIPHRLLSLGVPRVEFRHYGTPEEHIRGHGLDARGLRASIDGWLARAA